jgi:hypothetical protein
MRLALSMIVCLALVSGIASGQTEPRSAQLAKQLVSAMTARQLDAIAAPDPDEPGRFIAALAFPEVQLLAVSSRHKAADYLALQISKKQFREVYVLLQESSAATRLMVHDMGCDGLVADGNNVDTFYEGANERMLFDGKWEAQSLTEATYTAKQKAADEKYSRLLTVLLDAVKKIPVPTGA